MFHLCLQIKYSDLGVGKYAFFGHFHKDKIFDAGDYKEQAVFLLGTRRFIPQIPSVINNKESIVLEVKGNLAVVDAIEGACMENDNFMLLPRSEVTDDRISGKGHFDWAKIYEAFDTLERGSSRTAVRTESLHRHVVLDGEGSKYINIGTSRKQMGTGTIETMKSLDEMKNRLCRDVYEMWHKRVEHCAEKYLPLCMRRLLQVMNEMCSHNKVPFQDNKYSKIWPSVISGRNVFLNVHSDDDYFMGMITVIGRDVPITDAPIVCYFCFPTLGIAVALRNGDLLMFNPKLPHCVSSRCNPKYEAFCVSMYTKSLLVGGNDNAQELSEEEKVWATLAKNCS